MTVDGTPRVGPKGQVVIPKKLRDQLGIQPGDHVRFWIEGGHVAADLAQAPGAGAPLRARFAGRGLLQALAAERAEERRREDSR